MPFWSIAPLVECIAYGIEAAPIRLETMRRLVLYLAAREPLVLEPSRKEQPAHAPNRLTERV